MVYLRIDELRKKALEDRVPIMQDEGIEFMINYIKENNVKSILEIGSAVGYSAIRFASVDPQIKVTTIERDNNMFEQASANINNFNLNEQIKIIYGDALNVEIDGKFDLIFIDAAKSQYIKFFEKYSPNLKKDGAIISDNLSFHGLVEDDSKVNNRNTKQLVKKLRKYIEYLKNNDIFDTQFFKIGDGLSVSKWSKGKKGV